MKPLYPNKKFLRKDYKFQVVDVEANHWVNFLCGGFYDGETYTEFRKLDDLMRSMYRSDTELNCFAHYGGGYDFLFFIEALLKNKIEIKDMIMRGSLILSIKFKGEHHDHTLRDSSALLPFSLDSLSKNFNVDTKKGEYDHSLNRGYNKELAEYLRSDCLALYQVLQKFYGSHLIRSAGYSTTIASQAQKIMATYQKESMFAPTDTVNEFYRKACHGGRTEIFKPLGEKIYEYDVNSLYPFVMRNNEFMSGRNVGTRKFIKGKLGIYKVRVTAPKNLQIPIIPFKDDVKLIFPLGTFETHITSAEIEYAETLGYKFKVLDGYYSTEKADYFKEFIDDLYTIRQKSEKGTVENVLSKLIMNSAYGKFIIKKERKNLIIDPEPGAVFYKDVVVNGETYELYEKDIVLNTYSHCGIGAFILAYARIHMHKLMNPIAKSVYYTDTDSIWTDKVLKSGDKLGELKLEKATPKQDYYDRTCFLLPKTYIAETKEFKKIAMKGFDRRKIDKFNFKDFETALFGEIQLQIDVEARGANRLKTGLKQHKFLSVKKAYTKQIRSKYNKRELNLKDNSSKPLILG